MNPYNTSEIFGGQYNASVHYDAVKVSLASSETIRAWSHGVGSTAENVILKVDRSLLLLPVDDNDD